jgi:hypothetical protein
MECEHYRGIDDTDWESPKPVCNAFPDGIPKKVWLYLDPHTSPIPGDGGILFSEGPMNAEA